MRVFLDTNILLDVLARRDPFFEHSARIWTMAEQGEIVASVSVLSFNNIYYIVRKAEGKEKAAKALRLMRDIFVIVAPGRQIVDRAVDSEIDDFEDAVQYFSASRSRADYLITRDASGFPASPLPVLSPQEFLVLWNDNVRTRIGED